MTSRPRPDGDSAIHVNVDILAAKLWSAGVSEGVRGGIDRERSMPSQKLRHVQMPERGSEAEEAIADQRGAEHDESRVHASQGPGSQNGEVRIGGQVANNLHAKLRVLVDGVTCKARQETSMSVQEAEKTPFRRMWVPLRLTIAVVQPMLGCPIHRRALQSKRPQSRQEPLPRGRHRKASVAEVPVVPDRYAHMGEQKRHQKYHRPPHFGGTTPQRA
mmetsp:Transcript_139905/g.447472  ORF Transcript_139905/g.447472 Transcript_139905/m.447472 type:complete len:217 (-) Transcript_139905:53-703(-)